MSNSVPYLEPHTYSPSAMHMGDCSVCGYPEQNEIHTNTPAPEARAQHTPGPWHIVDADLAINRWIVGDHEDGSIADCSPCGPWVDDEVADANARLIAAAPATAAERDRLRKVLEEVEEYFDQRADAEYLPGQAAPVGNEEMGLLTSVRAALAATPEEPKP